MVEIFWNSDCLLVYDYCFYHSIVDPGYFEEYTSLEPNEDTEEEEEQQQQHKDELNILYNATDGVEEPIYDNFQNNTAL